MGLLAAVAVALTLGLTGKDDTGTRGGGSVVVDSDGYGAGGLPGLDAPVDPSVSASGGRPGASGTPSAESSASARAGASGSADSRASDGAAAPGRDAAPSGARSATPVPGTGVVSHASRRCVDVVGGKAVPGAGLMVWDCSGSASQHWTFPADGTMRALGMCVEPAGGSTSDGVDLRMAVCDGGSAQQISLNSRHDVVSRPADTCMDVRDNLMSNGARLQLWSCNGHDNQKWSAS